MFRLILFALPFVVAWFVSPQGVPLSLSNILEGDASVLDWIKIGGLTLLSLFLFAMAGKKN